MYYVDSELLLQSVIGFMGGFSASEDAVVRQLITDPIRGVSGPPADILRFISEWTHAVPSGSVYITRLRGVQSCYFSA